MDADREWPLALGENGRSGGQGGRGRGSIRGAGLGGSGECKRARVWLSLIYILRFRTQRGPSDNLYADLQGEGGQSAMIMTQASDFLKWKRGSCSSASCSNPLLDSIHLPVPNLPSTPAVDGHGQSRCLQIEDCGLQVANLQPATIFFFVVDAPPK
jgi:hypothetical protein